MKIFLLDLNNPIEQLQIHRNLNEILINIYNI